MTCWVTQSFPVAGSVSAFVKSRSILCSCCAKAIVTTAEATRTRPAEILLEIGNIVVGGRRATGDNFNGLYRRLPYMGNTSTIRVLHTPEREEDDTECCVADNTWAWRAIIDASERDAGKVLLCGGGDDDCRAQKRAPSEVMYGLWNSESTLPAMFGAKNRLTLSVCIYLLFGEGPRST